MIRVSVLDATLAPVGEVSELLTLDARPRWREPGGWRLEARGEVADGLRAPGASMVVRASGEVVFSGPVRDAVYGPSGTLTASGVDDLVWLGWRRALTGSSSPMPLTKVYDDEAETSIYRLVDDNAGPGADADRRVVTLDADQGRGDVGSWEATGQPVADLARQIAVSAGFGLQVRWTPTKTRLFTVLVPRDRTAQVRLSDVGETIADWERTVAGPDATHVYVGGEVDSDLEQRVVVDGGVASPWGRIEVWEDARTADTTVELEQVRDDTLADSGAVDQLVAEVAPTGAFQFPGDWRLGDLVTVVAGGVRAQANVVGLNITESDVRPVLSDGRVVAVLPSHRRLRELERRMARQETL